MAKKTCESEELYAALGKFLVSFTEIEHWSNCLLGILTDDQENIWLTLFLIDDLMTGKTREKIHSVANLRLQDNEELLGKLKGTLNEVEEVTKIRNRLVHGQWIFDSTMTKVHNYKLKRNKELNVWERLNSCPPQRAYGEIRETRK
jgi:hypothetical protein